jgi:hypothetical protein
LKCHCPYLTAFIDKYEPPNLNLITAIKTPPYLTAIMTKTSPYLKGIVAKKTPSHLTARMAT